MAFTKFDDMHIGERFYADGHIWEKIGTNINLFASEPDISTKINARTINRPDAVEFREFDDACLVQTDIPKPADVISFAKLRVIES